MKVLGKAFGMKLITAVYLLTTACIVNIPLTPKLGELREITVLGEGKDKILIVNISGVISWERINGRLFGPSEASIVSRIKEELEKAEKDEQIKAIVFKVDSPGGLVSASEAIYNEIKRFKERKKVPLVAYISTLGVSGSYYVITPCDIIIASPASLVGSIGVYMLKPNIEKLSEKVGIEFEVIKGGKHKDSLLFHRKMTDEEKQKYQKIIDYYYSKFKEKVIEGRGSKLKKDIDEIADGSAFSPAEALEIGLIDGIGNIYSAIDEAAKFAKTQNWKAIVYAREGQQVPTIWAETYAKEDLQNSIQKLLLKEKPLILYIYPLGDI